MRKTFMLCTFGAVALSASSLPVVAGAAAPKGGIQPSTVEDWATDVSGRLSDLIVWSSSDEGTGTALVQRSVYGRVIIRDIRASDRQVEAATRLALSRIRNLPPMPAGMNPDRTVRINIMLGGVTHRSFQQQRKAMMAAAAETNGRWSVQSFAASDSPSPNQSAH